MAADSRKSQLGNNTESSGDLRIDGITEFIKSKNLDSAALILLDILIPFKRPLSALLAVSEPSAELFFGRKTAEKIAGFALDGDSFEKLRKNLERGSE